MFKPRRRAYRDALDQFNRTHREVTRILYDERPYDQEKHSEAWAKDTKSWNNIDKTAKAAGIPPSKVAQDRLDIMGRDAEERLARTKAHRA